MTFCSFHLRAEQLRRNACHLRPLSVVRAAARQCCGSPHATHFRRVQCLTQAPHEKSNIGALSAAIRMHLIQNQVSEPLCSLDQRLLKGACEDKFQHDVVGE